MPCDSRASNSLPNASDVPTDPTVPGESPRCRGRAATFPLRRGPSRPGAFEELARRGRVAERVFGRRVSSDTLKPIPAGIGIQLAFMPRWVDPCPRPPGATPGLTPRPCPSTPRHPPQVGSHPAVAYPGRVMQGTHPDRHLFREVPIEVHRQGASRAVRAEFSDAADDPVPLHGCPTRSGSGWGRDGAQPYRHCLGLCPVSLPSLLRVFAPPRESPPPQCGPYAFSPAGMSNGSHWERGGIGQVANAENAHGGL